MFQVPGFDSWDKYRLLSHGPTLPYQMFHLSPLWMPTARKTLLCPGWQGMSYYIQRINFPHSHFREHAFSRDFFVNFRTFYVWLLHKYLLKHKCIKIIRTILMIMSHLRSLFDWKACRVFLKLPGLGISLLMYDFSMYFKHTNSLIESIVNGQIDLEATIRRTLLLLSKLTVITILSISAFLWDRLPEYPRKMLQMSQTHLRSNT